MAPGLRGFNSNPSPEVKPGVKPRRQSRKVLIVECDSAISNLLCVLLGGLGCEGNVALGCQQALSMVSRESFDAVLLDLRCSNLPAEQVISQMEEIRPHLVGRVLVITGDTLDPKTIEFIERHCLPHVHGNRLMPDVWGRLQALPVSRLPKAAS
jgi:CheY-like chemotaxis protein